MKNLMPKVYDHRHFKRVFLPAHPDHRAIMESIAKMQQQGGGTVLVQDDIVDVRVTALLDNVVLATRNKQSFGRVGYCDGYPGLLAQRTLESLKSVLTGLGRYHDVMVFSNLCNGEAHTAIEAKFLQWMRDTIQGYGRVLVLGVAPGTSKAWQNRVFQGLPVAEVTTRTHANIDADLAGGAFQVSVSAPVLLTEILKQTRSLEIAVLGYLHYWGWYEAAVCGGVVRGKPPLHTRLAGDCKTIKRSGIVTAWAWPGFVAPPSASTTYVRRRPEQAQLVPPLRHWMSWACREIPAKQLVEAAKRGAELAEHAHGHWPRGLCIVSRW